MELRVLALGVGLERAVGTAGIADREIGGADVVRARVEAQEVDARRGARAVLLDVAGRNVGVEVELERRGRRGEVGPIGSRPRGSAGGDRRGEREGEGEALHQDLRLGVDAATESVRMRFSAAAIS
jgi:hypothetical protein